MNRGTSPIRADLVSFLVNDALPLPKRPFASSSLFFCPAWSRSRPPFPQRGAAAGARPIAGCFAPRQCRARIAAAPEPAGAESGVGSTRTCASRAGVLGGEGGDVPLKDQNISDFISPSHGAFREKTRFDENINPLRKKQRMYVVENEMSVAMWLRPLPPSQSG
jgi:hypothetical protein